MNRSKSPRYWFKRRRYGYGWTPSTWQGWAALVLLLVGVIWGAVALLNVPGLDESVVWIYLAVVMVYIVGLVILVIKKGPSPKWRWGKKDDDNPNEDF